MKKLFAIGIAVVIAVAISAISYADAFSTTKTVDLTVDVASIFGFSVWEDELSQTAAINPGEAALFDLHMTCVSNRSNIWSLNAASAGMNTMPPDVTIPCVISTFKGGEEETPNEPMGTFVTDLELTTTAQTIYTSAPSEAPGGCVVPGLVAVTTDASTPAGIYMGYVQITMTD